MIKVGVGPSGIPTVTAPNSGPTIAAYIRGVESADTTASPSATISTSGAPRC